MPVGVGKDSIAAVVGTVASSDTDTGIDTNRGIHMLAAGSVVVVSVVTIVSRNQSSVDVRQEVGRRGLWVHAASSCQPSWRWRSAWPGVFRWRPVSNHILSSRVDGRNANG